jgi:hypothetical protein
MKKKVCIKHDGIVELWRDHKMGFQLHWAQDHRSTNGKEEEDPGKSLNLWEKKNTPTTNGSLISNFLRNPTQEGYKQNQRTSQH